MPQLSNPWIVALIGLGLFMVLMLMLRLVFKSRVAGGLFSISWILLLALLTSMVFLVGLNFYTYKRLTYEQAVATISIQQLGPQLYELTLVTPDEPHFRKNFEIRGDEWQMDAQVLKWKGWANLLGFNALYRLDRIGGRYRDVEQARENRPTVYDLREQAGLDLFSLATDHPKYLPFVDASYGSGTYLPMVDGQVYEVMMSQTGLLARVKEGGIDSGL